MAGNLGKSFRMTRSVRQGCPLAPYLFIIAAVTLHYQIDDRYWQIQGLPLPEDAGMMLDTEYVDDTTTYVKGDANNLDRLQSAMNEFCRGLGAKINWNKLVGIWISNKPVVNWAPDPNFRWLRRGEATRYLGFKIGMDIDRSEHYNLLVDKIKAKLIWWNARKLSFAGKIVIANQVLMATIWHTTCWIIAPKLMKVDGGAQRKNMHVQRLHGPRL